MKDRFSIIAIVCAMSCLLASVAVAGDVMPTAVTFGSQLTPTGEIQQIVAPTLDLDALIAEDIERNAADMVPRYAINHAVNISTTHFGLWESVDAQTSVWRLRIASEGAPHLNLGFTRFYMPAGGQLLIYADDLSTQMRAFTHADVADHGELWTPVLRGNSLTIEITIPNAVRDQLDLQLDWVNIGYRGFGAPDPLEGDTFASGSCNNDVVCPVGVPWLDEIPSVAVISRGGSLNCTGFMVNNTAQDETPYFMTARHCGYTSSNAASFVGYWNYETSTCQGTPDGSLSDSTSGATFRASYSPSDFTLLELSSQPDPSYGVAYAGWNATGADATSAVAIHHPSVDEKRISFENQATTTTSYLNNAVPGDGTHVRVIDWDDGTTEGGSSGSPLFNQNHQVIGQLHGGYASCSSQTSDWYGKFSVSWTGGGTNSTRLSNWLDPIGSGQLTLDTLGGSSGTCTVNADCDDGLFCNGSETCTGDACQSGSNPCSGGDICNEATNSCDPPPTCGAKGDSCSSNSDCCNNKCRGKRGRKSCK